jgi:hypothetical protein
MAHGVPTDEDLKSKFRASYLFTGNASKSGREVGIPDRTARKLAQELVSDSEYAEHCRRQRALDIEEHAEARRAVRRISLKRFKSETGGIDVKQFGGEGPVVVTDKRHEYGKLILDSEKNAQALARFEAERDGSLQSGGPVFILNEAPNAEVPAEAEDTTVDAS